MTLGGWKLIIQVVAVLVRPLCLACNSQLLSNCVASSTAFPLEEGQERENLVSSFLIKTTLTGLGAHTYDFILPQLPL